jgi:HSP20 family protein
MAMQRRDPFSDILSLRDAMSQLFEQSIVRPTGGMGSMSGLVMDLYAEDDHYVLEIALAGVKQDSLEITALGNQLMIQGEFATPAEQQQGRQYMYRQLPRGRFEQTVSLPTEIDADKIQAHYENGLLRITLPKAESAKRRRIAIQGGQAQQLQGAQSQRS